MYVGRPTLRRAVMSLSQMIGLGTTSTNEKNNWYRYMDDKFVICPHGKEKLKGFLECLNIIHLDIRLTTETNDLLRLLDILATHKPGGKQGHTIHTKLTHVDLSLHVKSHHHPS
jgi:hypothetical protein